MSIIMLAGESSRNPARVGSDSSLDMAVRDLLDHIAVELAAEYVRLMETAASAEVGSLRQSREKIFRPPPIEWIKDRVDHLQDVLEQRTARSAQALRNILGPIRLEPVTPDIGRPCYRAITSIDALALTEAPPSGAEGGSNSLQRWRRRESNPRPRSRKRWRLRVYPAL